LFTVFPLYLASHVTFACLIINIDIYLQTLWKHRDLDTGIINADSEDEHILQFKATALLW